MELTFGSLFAGIGGIDLGLERAGWECRWQVEWDAYCQHVLAHHWPDVPRYGDITAVDWAAVEPVDLLAGGFPCQPVSIAGRKGAQGDERWLWPEFLRAIRALRPRFVLVENVTNLLAVNDGSAFGDVVGDLAASGYDAEWDCVPAAAVGAPHIRDRLWVVAHAERRELGIFDGAQGTAGAVSWDGGQVVADADGERRGHEPNGYATLPIARRSDTGSSDGNPGWWRVEPDVGRVADGVPARVDRLRALGNAVVPQVVEMIGRRLADYLAELAP
jgi:DNA (cytosine-5)-methyltransferase 1